MHDPTVDRLTIALIDLLLEAVREIDEANHGGHICKEYLPDVYGAIRTAELAAQTWAENLQKYVEKRSEEQ